MTRPSLRPPRIVFALALAAVVAVIWLSKLGARRLGWDPGLTALGVVLVLSGLMSLALGIQRHVLRKKLRRLPEDEVQALAARSDDIRYLSATRGARPVWQVVAVGVFFVTLPTLPLLVGPVALLQLAFAPEPPVPQFVALFLGFAAAGCWWAWTAPIWRQWAERQGLSRGEVQYHGERASILWPRGHLLARTERRRPDGDDA